MIAERTRSVCAAQVDVTELTLALALEADRDRLVLAHVDLAAVRLVAGQLGGDRDRRERLHGGGRGRLADARAVDGEDGAGRLRAEREPGVGAREGDGEL